MARALPQFSTNIQITVEPGDNGATLTNAINGAKKSVHMVMYLLSSTPVINALKSRAAAGVDVKVLLNETFPSGMGSNSTVYSQLSSAGVSVAWAPSRFTLTHEKTVIVDGTSALIMTMNATASSPTSNREYLALDTNADDVAEAEALFEADWGNTPITPTGRLAVSPDNSATRIGDVMGTATKTLDVEVEELSDSRLVYILGYAAGHGVKVRVVLPTGTLTTAQQSAVTTLKSAGVKMVALDNPYIHAKAVVADGDTAFVGSENFTSASLDGNRELGVCFTGTGVSTVASTIAADFAAGTAL
jgi:phosphatidylserine/phosphatidylglycerophosphate/cardiolipin synthase-like enzyme